MNNNEAIAAITQINRLESQIRRSLVGFGIDLKSISLVDSHSCIKTPEQFMFTCYRLPAYGKSNPCRAGEVIGGRVVIKSIGINTRYIVNA